MKNNILNIAIILCAVAVGGLAGYIVYNYFNETESESEEVFVNLPIASHDLENASFITQTDIEYLRIPESEIPENAIIDSEELLNLIVADHTTISQGSFFTNENTDLNFIADIADESLPLTSGWYSYSLVIQNASTYEIGDYINV